jgi:hypothetical protein
VTYGKDNTDFARLRLDIDGFNLKTWEAGYTSNKRFLQYAHHRQSLDNNGNVTATTTSTQLFIGDDTALSTGRFDVRSTASTFTATSLTVNSTATLFTGTSFTVNANLTNFIGNTLTFSVNTLTFNASSVEFINSGTLRLTVAKVYIGTDINNSTLYVEKIQSFDENGSVFFPGGIKFPDNTTQLTAYPGDFGVLGP